MAPFRAARGGRVGVRYPTPLKGNIRRMRRILLVPATVVASVLLLAACHRRESVEAARARAVEDFLKAQLVELKELIVKAERGELVTKDRLAIGVSEDSVKSLIDASLPQEQQLGQRVRVRLESAQAYFRGNNAGLIFQASAHGKMTGATARLELGGRLQDFRIDAGVLRAEVELVHFKVIQAPGGDLASDVLERLAKDNADALKRLIPPLELPVSLKQSIEIAGLEEGVVTTRSGVLPLEIAVAETLPLNQRLWILLDVKAGPWKKGAAPKPAPVAKAAPAPKATPAAKKP
jgi:hypothetical protein